MKVSVFVYAALIFCITLFISVSDYAQRFNLHRTLQHAYHRSLIETMEKDLFDKESIKETFVSLFLPRIPTSMDYTIKLLDFNSSPKVLRIHVEARHEDKQFIYDETLIEEVVRE